MRWIGRAIGLFGLSLLAVAWSRAIADDPSKPAGSVDRVLADWRAKASTIESVEVKFRQTTDDKQWGEIRSEGRAILGSPPLALLEMAEIAADGKVGSIEHRMIWQARALLFFEMANHRAIRVALEKDLPAAPGWLRLPFLYKMTVEDLKRDYDVELLAEDDRKISLSFRPRATPTASRDFRIGLLELDRQTFLPTRMILTDEEGRSPRTIVPTSIRLNQVENTDDLTVPCLDAWSVQEVSGSAARLFLP